MRSTQAATVLSLGAGEERNGIDIVLQSIRATTLTGTILGLPEATWAQITAVRQDEPPPFSPSTRTQQDGTFVLPNLAPGPYVVVAWTVPAPPAPGTSAPSNNGASVPRLWASTQIVVTGDRAQSVLMTLEPGRSLSGQLRFETSSSPPDLSRTRFTASVVEANDDRPGGGVPAVAVVQADGRFTFEGLVPGRYRLRVDGPGAFLVKSSIVNGQDTLDFPFELTGDADVAGAVVTMTDQRNEVSGTLTLASGGPAADYTVVLAPAEERFWVGVSRRVQAYRTDADGRFLLRSIPPGSYFLAAASDLDPGSQYDPGVLRTLSVTSVPVNVSSDSAKLVQNLRVTQ